MKIQMAPEAGLTDVRHCPECGENTFHDAVLRMLFSPSGARTMPLWQCEKHPLPEIVNDEPRPKSVLHTEGDTSAMIANPTLAEMIALLARMVVDHGPDALVEVKPLSNALGSFVVRIVSKEVAS